MSDGITGYAKPAEFLFLIDRAATVGSAKDRKRSCTQHLLFPPMFAHSVLAVGLRTKSCMHMHAYLYNCRCEGIIQAYDAEAHMHTMCLVFSCVHVCSFPETSCYKVVHKTYYEIWSKCSLVGQSTVCLCTSAS
jgi:hypothetical protein